jgi:hypothetical protein
MMSISTIMIMTMITRKNTKIINNCMAIQIMKSNRKSISIIMSIMAMIIMTMIIMTLIIMITIIMKMRKFIVLIVLKNPM